MRWWSWAACALAAGCGGSEESEPGAGGGVPVVPPPPDVEGIAPFEDMSPDPATLEVSLVAAPGTLQLMAGAPTDLLTYNEQLPGPLLHARVGDRVIVHFENQLAEPTTVHWHGLRISDQMDGSPLIQNPVQPGASFTYDFVVPEAGTFWYHTHFHQIEQFERGLYGAIVVHEAHGEMGPPVFSRERVFMTDDVRLTSDNAIAPFLTSGPDIGRGRVGNYLLVNGQPIPHLIEIPRGAIERWRFILATNALSHGLRMQGADVRVIGTDGGLLPQAFALDRVDVAPGQRYELEVRPRADAAEVVLEALILQLDENDQIVEVPFPLIRAAIVGEVSAAEPVYPLVEHPPVDVPAETLEWALAGSLVNGAPQFTIDGMSTFVGEGHEHVLLHTFTPNQPVKIRFSSTVSPEHPFHIHGQFFQILERNGQPVFEPGLRDTVKVVLQENVTILSYFENPGRWMVHCHISEHSENGMMADILVGAAADQHHP